MGQKIIQEDDGVGNKVFLNTLTNNLLLNGARNVDNAMVRTISNRLWVDVDGGGTARAGYLRDLAVSGVFYHKDTRMLYVLSSKDGEINDGTAVTDNRETVVYQYLLAQNPVVAGLTNGDSYVVRLRARSVVGDVTAPSGDSSPAVPEVPTVPTKPIGMGAGGMDRGALIWMAAPADNGRSPVTKYQYKKETTTGGTSGAWEDVQEESSPALKTAESGALLERGGGIVDVVHGNIQGLAISPNGNFLLTAGGGRDLYQYPIGTSWDMTTVNSHAQ